MKINPKRSTIILFIYLYTGLFSCALKRNFSVADLPSDSMIRHVWIMKVCLTGKFENICLPLNITGLIAMPYFERINLTGNMITSIIWFRIDDPYELKELKNELFATGMIKYIDIE